MTLYQFYPITTEVFSGPFSSAQSHTLVDDPKGEIDNSNHIKLQPFDTIFRFTKTVRPMFSIGTENFLQIHYRTGNPDFNAPHIVMGLWNGATYAELADIFVPPDTVWRTRRVKMALDPFTSLPWVPADWDNYELYFRSSTVGNTNSLISQYFADIDGVPATAGDSESQPLGLERGATSAIVQLFRRPMRIVDVELPLRYYDVPLLRWLTLSHYAGPTPDSVGWDPTSIVPWRRSRIFVLQKDIQPANGSVKIHGLIERDIVLRVWDVLVSEETPKPDIAAGMARFHQRGRLLARSSPAWVENAEAEAQGSINILSLEGGQDKHAPGGTWFERLRTNWLERTSSISGATGLTDTGTAVNGSAINIEETELIFDGDVTEKAIRFIAGDPVADVYRTWPVTEEFHANSRVALVFYHNCDSPIGVDQAPIAYSVQRATDSKYFDALNPGTWSASIVWNPLTVSVEVIREKVGIDVGANPTTLTMRIGIDNASGVASQENVLYHVHLADGYNPGTPLVSDDAIAQQAADDLNFSSGHGRELAWNPEHGHVFAEVTPDWSASELDDGDERVVAEILYPHREPYILTVPASEGEEFDVEWVDDDDFDRLSYVHGTGWRMRRRLAGVDTDAELAATPVTGQTYRVGGAWTGPQGEQDRAPYTMSVYADGVKGTDALAAGSHGPLPDLCSLTVGASQRWRPTDLTGLKLWVEADRGVMRGGSLQDLGIGLFNDEVCDEWQDQSGNDLHLVRGPVAPRLQLGYLNGLDALFLNDDDDQFYTIPDLGLTESHWFFLVKFNSVADGMFLLGSVTGGLQGSLRTAGGKLQILGAAATWFDLIDPIEADTWMILEIAQYGTTVQGMKNGIHGGPRVTATADYSGQDLQLGADAGAGTKDQYAYAVLVYDRVLRMDEARLPLSYLASKASLSAMTTTHRVVFKHFDGTIRHLRVGDVVPYDAEFGDMP